MKSLNAKTDVSIFINLRYLLLKLLKNKDITKKIYVIFFIISSKKNPCYVTSEVFIDFFYFVRFDGLT